MSKTSGDFDDLARLTPDLESLGWGAELDHWAAAVAEDLEVDDVLTKGRLARVSRGFSLVFTGGDAVLAASARTRADVGQAPATGDFVLLRDDPEDGPSIAAIAERRSALQRRAAGRVPEPQIMAANAETVFVMHGLDRPLNLRRIERQLVVAWDSGAQPVVLLTKADTTSDAEETVAQVSEVAPGVDVLAASMVTGLNLDRVADFFAGRKTIALLGLSGIGKSTLVNALSDGLVQRTGEVRATDHRGRHTTVTRDLIPLPTGGFILDAPGLREIGLWQAYEGMAKTFPEVEAAATACRFADCSHDEEPDCGVRSGLADRSIEPRRLDHWRELHAELALQEEQLEEFARRSESRDRADAQDQQSRTRSSRKTKGRGKRNRR